MVALVGTQEERRKILAEKTEQADNLVGMTKKIAQDRKHPGVNITVDELFSEDGTPNINKLRDYSHLRNVENTVRSANSILIDRATEAENAESGDEESSFEYLERRIQDLHDAGYSLEEAIEMINEMQIAKSSTHHPTEHLNPEGIKKFKALIKAAENADTHQRREQIAQAIEDMLDPDSPIAANYKNTMVDEIEGDKEFALDQIKGVNRLRRHIRKSLEKAYHTKVEIGDIKPRIGRISWTYDADGKNNAEGWAMMSTMAFETLGAFDLTIDALEVVAGGEEKIAQIKELRANLSKIYGRTKTVLQELSDLGPEERKTRYAERYEEYNELSQEFLSLYDSVGNGGAKGRKGFGFFNETLETIKALHDQKDDPDSEQAQKLEDAYGTLQTNGFVLQKGQMRHNDLINRQILSNLFADDEFLKSDLLDDEDRQVINEAGGWDELPETTRVQIALKIEQSFFIPKDKKKDKAFKKAIEAKRKKFNDALYRSNPLEFEDGGNGYPLQTRTYLDRVALHAPYRLKFKNIIISEAGEYAPIFQSLLCSAVSAEHADIMPLHEDRLTLPKQGDLFIVFMENGGEIQRASKKEIAEKNPEFLAHVGGRGIHDYYIMRACSDSSKTGGQATVPEAADVIRKAIRIAWKASLESDSGAPIEIMFGTGISSGRFGGDIPAFRRIIEQEMKEIAKEEREKRADPNWNFDRNNKKHRRFLRAAMNVSYTEQGRGKRLFNSTPGQFADSAAGIMAEMIEGQLDLEGLVPDHTFIPEKPSYPDRIKNAIKSGWNGMINSFFNLRHAKKQNDEGFILDNLAQFITCPNIIGYLNYGARPGSKISGAKNMTAVRAIENNQRDMLSAMRMGGSYGAGQMLWKWKTLDGMSPHEMKTMITDPEMDYTLFNIAVSEAGCADFSRSLEQVGLGDMTFDELIELGKSVRLHKANKDDEHHKILFDNMPGKNITEEQAYLAKLYYDRTMLIAQMDAALTGKGTIDISALRAKEGINVDLTDSIKDHYPEAMNTISEHQQNKDMFEIMHKLEAYIVAEKEKGRTVEDIVENDLGGEETLREIASAYRAGTLSHATHWNHEKTLFPHKGRDVDVKMKRTPKAEQRYQALYGAEGGGDPALVPSS